ncbi:bifunctional hydroxymethylpyrimidine kinase/phosphomethylpyrimidine kinase [Demequina sp. B12]|uniref:bifunctional hydroxymethylpyrimidine kinase/phosphomethylpyrimidine kinase n=1 Tax=Demequina sp. B12 TaxID=2992757 RepID=UPI00237A4BF6|nr:bifunctional hydroxymethylpyrimidine kinase/phosphomethylpyrimidine kinase [Demequina sp. B12]MDE0571900.1 bifunctional hydroxymethylpyrimidine kinase/phosphomethylpyrimidine kinase [Demequina sp. B12]
MTFSSPDIPDAPRVLSIAGTDPTGGAGIQADLKAIAAHGGYGMAVVTALVAQNTQGVRGVHAPPAQFLAAQLEAVSDDVDIDAVKIGMLFDSDLISVVRGWLERTQPPVVVIDPVMVATSGDRLLTADAEEALRALLPLADMVTPNVPELAALLEQPVAQDWATVLRQAETLAQRYDVTVLAKGGHLAGDVVRDAIVAPCSLAPVILESPRVETTSTHGTGCSLSSAVATLRARTGRWDNAVAQAKEWLTRSLEAASALHVGQGHGPISHFADLWQSGLSTAPEAGAIADAWWDGTAEVRGQIDSLEFVQQLGDGDLNHDDFLWYVKQDALYLRDYSRVLAAASSLAPTAQEQAFWARGAHTCVTIEIALHRTYLRDSDTFDAEPSPVTTAYTDHLLAAAARGDYAVLTAAVLPCYWVYHDVGTRLSARNYDGHPYGAWLETYADEQFAEATREAIGYASAAAARADAETRRAATRAFELSTRHERDFFAAPLVRSDLARMVLGDEFAILAV